LEKSFDLGAPNVDFLFKLYKRRAKGPETLAELDNELEVPAGIEDDALEWVKKQRTQKIILENQLKVKHFS